MKTITEYECEVCHRRYHSAGEARACEDQPDWRQQAPPVGLVYGNASEGFYAGITFAVAQVVPVPFNPHSFTVAGWAARDNGAGDSLGADTCGGGYHTARDLPLKLDAPDPRHPTFRRLVARLQADGVPTTCADGKGGIVSLAEYLSNPPAQYRGKPKGAPARGRR